GAAALADDDAVGTHAQRVAQEVALGDLAAALDVAGPGLQPAHVRLLELELGRILDGYDALGGGDERRQAVEQRGLARSRAARDEDVQPRPHHLAQDGHYLGRERSEIDEVVHGVGIATEPAD